MDTNIKSKPAPTKIAHFMVLVSGGMGDSQLQRAPRSMLIMILRAARAVFRSRR
jgi:hypothetical protein